MADNFQVSVTADKATYNADSKDVVTLTLTGSDVVTNVVNSTVAISGTVVAPDGATGKFGPVNVQVSKTTTTNDSVKLQSVTDDYGLKWTISADGLHATAPTA